MYSRRIAVAFALCLLPARADAVPMDVPKELQEALPLPKSRAEDVLRMLPQGAEAKEPLHKALQAINAGRARDAIGPLQAYIKDHPSSAAAHELLGAAYALEGKLDEALVALRKAIATNPRQSSAYTKIADILLTRGKGEEALPMLLKAVEISPHDRLPHQRLGLLYERSGKTAEAIAHYQRGIAGTPADYLGVKLNLARLYNATGQYARTRELLEAAGKTTEGNADALLLLGTADLALGRTDEALRRYDAAARLEPNDPGGHLGLGIAHRQKGAYEASLAALNEVVRLRPKWSTGHFQIGETYFAQRRLEDAAASFERAAELNPRSALVRKRIADSEAGLGNWDAAIAIYRSLVEVPAMTAAALAALGTVYQLKGDTVSAQAALETLAGRFPNDPDAHRLLGQHFAARGDYRKGIEAFGKGLAIAPTHAGLLAAQAIAYGRSGDFDQALRHAEALVKAHPNDPDAHFLLGALHDDQGRSAAAQGAYRKALALDRGHVPALNNLAMSLANTGKPADAVRIAEQARKLAPQSPFIQATYGWTLLKANRTGEAIELLRASAQALPKDPSILYHLGSAYAAAGDKQRARSTLNEALELSTSFKEVAATRALLEKL
jgi:tetratricopeptide (TPR) repeat protein